MRADRLVAALLVMQARGRVTAAELAEELAVSVATARRDLEALAAAEAQALFLLVGPGAALVPAAKSALRKLMRALPDTFRADAEAAASAVVIDPARWGEHGRERPDLVDALQAAVVRRRKVRLAYASRARERSERLVDPWGLVDKDDIWYLVAGTEGGQRTFRIDRVIDAVVTDLVADRPADLELSQAWRRVVEEVEERRSHVSATVLIASELVGPLCAQFGRHCEVAGSLDDGQVRVRLAAPTALMIAQHLAGWGAAIEVVEPGSVRAELARIASELAERYAT